MKNQFSGNKRGNAVLDTLTVVIVLTIFIIVAVVGYMVMQKLDPQIRSLGDENSTSTKIWSNNYDKYPRVFDNLALFVFVGLWIMGLMASFMIDSHPIFAAVTFIVLIFVFFVAGIMANTYDSMINSDSALTSAAGAFVKSNFIMNHLLIITIMVGFSIAVVLYGKSR